MEALIANARHHFHERLFETNTLTLTTAGAASNTDTSSRGSKAISRRIVDILVDEQHHKVNTVDKISGQTLGKQFELLTMEFLIDDVQNLFRKRRKNMRDEYDIENLNPRKNPYINRLKNQIATNTDRDERIAVFEDTLTLCKKNERLRNSIRQSIAGQRLIRESDETEKAVFS